MQLEASEARRWIGDFEMAERAALEARRAEGRQTGRSLDLALSLIEAAWTAAGGHYPVDPRRAGSEAAARQAWVTLRERFRR